MQGLWEGMLAFLEAALEVASSVSPCLVLTLWNEEAGPVMLLAFRFKLPVPC